MRSFDESEIEFVAVELAKVGGTSWYPGRPRTECLRKIGQEYREKARIVIEAYDRFHGRGYLPSEDDLQRWTGGPISVGDLVVYCPGSDRRAIACTVQELDDDYAYLVPVPMADVGWVPVDNVQSIKVEQ